MCSYKDSVCLNVWLVMFSTEYLLLTTKEHNHFNYRFKIATFIF